MRPLIGMTVWIAPEDGTRVYPTPYTFEYLHRTYSYMIRRAQGVPVLLANAADPEEVDRLLGVLDGFLLTGGEDIEPGFYNEPVQTKTMELAADRDRFELMAVKKADELGLPILGICRGIQTLNVAYGGSLFQDLLEQRDRPTGNHSRGGPLYRRYHDVRIDRETRLHEIIGKDTIKVCTAHHQAIKDVGQNLRVTAHSAEDGVIEAVEVPGERFVLAVQWHPEVLPDDEATRRLAAAFVDAARRVSLT